MWENIIIRKKLCFRPLRKDRVDLGCYCVDRVIVLLDRGSCRLSFADIRSYAEENNYCKNDDNGNNEYHLNQCETLFRFMQSFHTPIPPIDINGYSQFIHIYVTIILSKKSGCNCFFANNPHFLQITDLIFVITRRNSSYFLRIYLKRGDYLMF